VSDAVVRHLIVGEEYGVDIAMNGIPPAGLVVEVVDGDASMSSISVFANEIFDPIAGPIGLDSSAGCGGCDPSDVATGGIGAAVDALRIDAVAACTAVGVDGDLVGVGGFWIAAGRGVLGYPAVDGNGAYRFCADGPVGFELRVECSCILHTRGSSVVFEIPVTGGAGDVELVVVAGGRLASPAIDGDARLFCGGARELKGIHAVDEGIDGVCDCPRID
jgi:hypothetical protein